MTPGPIDTEPESVEALLEAVGGKYAARILAAATEPVSAQELSEDLEVPIATCYRRIEDLVEADLLVCVGRKTSDRGRRTKVYRRTLDELALDLRDGRPELELERVPDPPEQSGERRNG